MKTQAVELIAQDGCTILKGTLTAPKERSIQERDSMLALFLHDLPFGHQESHGHFFGDLRPVFNHYQIHTFSFDFRGCGTSGGERSDFTIERAREDLQSALSWARGRGFEKFICVATGTSAALALEEASNTDKEMLMLFLFWPTLDLHTYLQKFDNGEGRALPEKMLESFSNYTPPSQDTKIRTPVFIQYGAQDDAYDIEQLEFLKKHIQTSRVDITSYLDGKAGLPDPRHRAMILKHLGIFMEKYLGSFLLAFVLPFPL